MKMKRVKLPEVVLGILVCICLSGCMADISGNSENDAFSHAQYQVRLPGEFEPAQGVLVVWPLNVPMELVQKIAEKDKVFLVVNTNTENGDRLKKAEHELSDAGVNMENVEFFGYPVGGDYSYWIRDFGPVFVFDDKKPEIVDFSYMGEIEDFVDDGEDHEAADEKTEDEDDIDSMYPDLNDKSLSEEDKKYIEENRESRKDKEIPQEEQGDDFPAFLAQKLNIPSSKCPIVLQGGNLMQDGRGTAVSGNRVLEENSNDIYSVREQMRISTGINNYMIIDDPNLDVIGHVDCFAKLVAPDKVIVGKVPKSAPSYNIHENVARYFSEADCCWGYPYKVYRVDIPEESYIRADEDDELDAENDDRYASPYTNSLILNKRVFVPIGENEEYNEKALNVYRKALPGYEVIGIAGPVPENMYDDVGNARSWYSFDALHCRTHEVPDFNMIFIDHRAVYNGVVNRDCFTDKEVKNKDNQEFEFETDVTAYSGGELCDGMPQLCYRIDGGKWNKIAMEKDSTGKYRAKVSGVKDGTQLEYYIYAKDEFGNENTQPQFGKLEPHKFTVKVNDHSEE